MIFLVVSSGLYWGREGPSGLQPAVQGLSSACAVLPGASTWGPPGPRFLLPGRSVEASVDARLLCLASRSSEGPAQGGGCPAPHHLSCLLGRGPPIDLARPSSAMNRAFPKEPGPCAASYRGGLRVLPRLALSQPVTVVQVSLNSGVSESPTASGRWSGQPDSDVGVGQGLRACVSSPSQVLLLGAGTALRTPTRGASPAHRPLSRGSPRSQP